MPPDRIVAAVGLVALAIVMVTLASPTTQVLAVIACLIAASALLVLSRR